MSPRKLIVSYFGQKIIDWKSAFIYIRKVRLREVKMRRISQIRKNA